MTLLPPDPGEATPPSTGGISDAPPQAGSAPFEPQPLEPQPFESQPFESQPFDPQAAQGEPHPLDSQPFEPQPLDFDPAPTSTMPQGAVVPRTQRAGVKRRRRRRLLIEWLVVLVIAAVVAIVLRAFVVQAFFVPSASMVPTLQEGDRILVIKSSLLAGSIAQGNIIVFRHPTVFPCASAGDDIEDLVKRVIGMPGDTIWSVGANEIFINGKLLVDPGWFRAGLPQVGATPIQRMKIPANDYFVMGDNRTDSCDSRTFGPIPASSVIGKVVAIVWRNGHPYLHFF